MFSGTIISELFIYLFMQLRHNVDFVILYLGVDKLHRNSCKHHDTTESPQRAIPFYLHMHPLHESGTLLEMCLVLIYCLLVLTTMDVSEPT